MSLGYWIGLAVGALAVSTVLALLIGAFIHAGASEDHRNREAAGGQRIRVEKEGAP